MKSLRILAATVFLALIASPAASLAQAHTIDKGMTMSHPATLQVPGATLYYETVGSGPTLLVIPGGPQDAGVFAALARELSDRYTVVTYDPRGNSRTTTTAPLGEMDIDVQGNDAAALIARTGGPAYVFGTSGGAQIGFNLAARHPGSVITLVAHEPPTTALLADPSAAQASDQALYDTYRTQGVEAAMGQFFAENGLDDAEAPPEFDLPPEEAATFERVMANSEYWLAHAMLPLSNYVPDIATLRAGKPRIVVAIGALSAGQPIAAMTEAAAGALGVTPVTFAGDHLGFGPEAEAFAESLDAALSGR